MAMPPKDETRFGLRLLIMPWRYPTRSLQVNGGLSLVSIVCCLCGLTLDLVKPSAFSNALITIGVALLVPMTIIAITTEIRTHRKFRKQLHALTLVSAIAEGTIDINTLTPAERAAVEAEMLSWERP